MEIPYLERPSLYWGKAKVLLWQGPIFQYAKTYNILMPRVGYKSHLNSQKEPHNSPL